MYGAASSLMAILVWVYYSVQILLYGAEFTQVYANRMGQRIQPTDEANAVNTAKAFNDRLDTRGGMRPELSFEETTELLPPNDAQLALWKQWREKATVK